MLKAKNCKKGKSNRPVKDLLLLLCVLFFFKLRACNQDSGGPLADQNVTGNNILEFKKGHALCWLLYVKGTTQPKHSQDSQAPQSAACNLSYLEQVLNHTSIYMPW